MTSEVPVPVLGKDILTADEVVKAIGSLGDFNFRSANMIAIDAMERMIVILKEKNEDLLKKDNVKKSFLKRIMERWPSGLRHRSTKPTVC